VPAGDDDAWKTFDLHRPPDEKGAIEAWVKARPAALHKAGMDPVFE
jgi:hypothetical protein